MGRHVIDEIGNRYGRLVVLERGENAKSGYAKWLCKCNCGNEKVILGTSLRNGDTRSCGCLHRGRPPLSAGEASFNKLIRSMKKGASERNHEWFLTKNQIRVLTKQNCHYCGIAPQQKIHPERCNGVYIYNGLDRVDSSKGYTLDNVVSCCGVCNYAKHTQTIEQFRAWLIRAYNHFIEESK